MRILIIIPAYNEQETILKVIEKLKNDYPRADYIVVNDCSTDNTLDKLSFTKASYVALPINLGIGGGVQTGYKYALEKGYDIAVQVDGDGQHDTSYLEKVIKPIEEGKADIVIGSRFITKEGFQSSGMRRIGINFLSKLIHICCGIKIYDVTSGFRAVNKKYIAMFANDYPDDYPEPKAIVQATLDGGRILEVPVIMKERKSGNSSIQSWKSVYYMIEVTLDIILCRISVDKKRV